MKRTLRSARLASFLLCIALLAGVLAACSSGSSNGSTGTAVAPGKAAQAASAAAAGNEGGAANDLAGGSAVGNSSSPAAQAAAAGASQKIIERLSYQMETQKFDESVSSIQKLCTDLGGYVQDSNVDGSALGEKGTLRSANFTLRIPQEKLGDLKSRAGQIATVLKFTSSSENVSDKYYDTEARLKSLRTQQERLLALLQKSGSLSDIVTLEKALADVNYEIEQLTGTLRQYNSLVSYSTVSVTISEVLQPTEQSVTPVTLWQKIAQQFQYSLRGLGSFGEGLLVFFLGNAPVLLLLVLIAAAVILILRRGKKRRAQMEQEFAAKIRREASVLEVPGQKPEDGPEQKS